MAINLDLLSSNGRDGIIDPRDVYAAISRRPWKFLRQEQGQVLGKWFDERHHQDAVIKQNTGGGKTAVGLLIAESSLREGFGPAVYLVPDSYLIEQVEAEAEKLEIETALEPTDPAFIAGEAVLIGTLSKLINGQSRFGVHGQSTEFVDVGTVIMDDAHSALATVEDQFKLEFKSDHQTYSDMLELFRDDLNEQSPPLHREIREGSYTALLRVPFWAWRSKLDQVVAIIAKHAKEKPAKFGWPLIKDQIAICSAIFTGSSLDIRPPAPPIHKIPSFVNARRRIYMTATLADDAVLTHALGVDPVFIQKAITPRRASDIGNRVILAPMEIDPTIGVKSVRTFARAYADGWPDEHGSPTREPINVVVLVPSTRAAQEWADYADATWNVDDLKTGVPRLRAGHVGLVVLANKYDGIDLPDDACRLLVIDGLPSTMDAVERREASAMMKSPRVLARQVQRVEQGMGRGVRDSSDYCAVLLVGPALTKVVHDPKQRALFSPATLVQLELSRQLAKQLTGLDAVREAVDLCLAQQPKWLAADRAKLALTDYRDEAVIRQNVVAGRQAFESAVAGDWGRAETLIATAAQQTTDPAEKGWLLEQQAVYRDVYDAPGAQGVLLAAKRSNYHVLQPVDAVSLPKVKAATIQAEAVGAYFTEHYSDTLTANLAIRELFDQLVWHKDASSQAEATWEEIGRILGLGSERPEVKYGTGPDNLWALPKGGDVIFELKTGALHQPIKKDDVDQFAGHVRWYERKFIDLPEPKPIIVHKSAEYDSRGTMPAGARVVTEDDVEKLREAMLAFTAAAPKTRWDDIAFVAEQLAALNLDAGSLVRAYSRKPVVSQRTL